MQEFFSYPGEVGGKSGWLSIPIHPYGYRRKGLWVICRAVCPHTAVILSISTNYKREYRHVERSRNIFFSSPGGAGWRLGWLSTPIPPAGYRRKRLWVCCRGGVLLHPLRAFRTSLRANSSLNPFKNYIFSIKISQKFPNLTF